MRAGQPNQAEMDGRGGMNQPGRRRALGLSFDNRVVLCAVVLVALIWSAAALVAQRDRQQAIDAAIHSNSQLARAFEQHTASAMAQVQQLAVLMRTQYQREGAEFDLPHWFEVIRFDHRFVQNAWITGANGRVVASSAGRVADVTIADREHFSVHMARDTGMLYISRPILTRVTGEWAILASLRINQPDVSFGGTVIISIDPSYFSDFYKEIDLGEQGAVSLIGLDGFVRARSKGSVQNAGQDIRGGELFRQLQNAPQGSFFATALVDGVRRIQSYRKLADYPLVVAVGTAEETALAEYYKHRNMYVLGAMLMTLLIVFAARWIRRSAVRQRNGAAVLLESENRLRQLTQSLEVQVEERTAQAHAREQLLRLVTENLPVLIGYFDVDQRIKFVNSRFAAVLGAADGEPMTGKPISELIPADLMAFHQPYIAAVLAGKPQRLKPWR